MNEQLSALALLFKMMDSRLRPMAKKHASALKKKYGQRNSQLIDDIVKFYEVENDINPSDVREMLQSYPQMSGVTDALVKSFEDTKSLGDAGVAKLGELFEKTIAEIVLNNAMVGHKDDPAAALKSIMDYDFSFNKSNAVSSKIEHYDLSTLDPAEVMNEFGTPIKSSVDAINDCFVAEGYLPHQLVCVVAPPSCGKSLFLANEAVHMIMDGKRVCYIALGDLSRLDFMTRFAAVGTGAPMSDVQKNLGMYWDAFKGVLGDRLKNFGVFYIDANVVSASELMDFISEKELDKKFDVFIVDYDTNFKSDNDMYQKGEEVYNHLANLSKRVDLVFVASQPKTSVFSNELIFMNDAAESGRKSQIVDIMITISKNQNSIGTQIGMINLAKVRRNGRGTHFPYMLNPSGRFIPISMQKYKGLESNSTQQFDPNSAMVDGVSLDELGNFTP